MSADFASAPALGETMTVQQSSPVLPDTAWIQSSSCVLILDSAIQSVLWMSENCPQWLSLSVETFNNIPVNEILGSQLYKTLHEGFSDAEQNQLSVELAWELKGKTERFSVTAWRSNGYLTVEFEPLTEISLQPVLSKNNHWLTQLSQISQSESVTQALVNAIADLTGFDRVCLHRFDAQKNSQVIAEHCRPGIQSLMGLSFPFSGLMHAFRRHLEQYVVISINDVNASPVKLLTVHASTAAPDYEQRRGQCWLAPVEYLDMLKTLDANSVLVIAIFQDDHLWGSVNCHGFQPVKLPSIIRHVSFNLVQMATQRLFLLTSREQNAFRQRVMDSRQLLSLDSDRLAEPAEMLADYGAGWCELFSACGVALVYEDGVFTYGDLPEDQQLDEIVDWLVEQRKTCLYTDDLASDFPDHNKKIAAYCGLLAISLPYDNTRPGWLLLFRSEIPSNIRWAVKPEHLAESELVAVEETSQWLQSIRGKSQQWTQIERQAAMDLGEDLAVVIAVHQISKLNQRFSETNQRLEQLAHTDTLTQIWNRYRMELAIDAEVAASSRYGRPCSLLLFDIDHFKQINDNFGHDVGDAVLAGIAWEVKTLLRASDHLGRWGGEEFIVLASNTDLAEAEKLAERLCRHIYALELETVGRISVSIGVTEWQTGDMRRDIVERADKAMYEAKETGRNRWLSDRKR